MPTAFVPFAVNESMNDFGGGGPRLMGQVSGQMRSGGGLGARIVGFVIFLVVLAVIVALVAVLIPVALVAVIVVAGLLVLLFAWIRLRLWWRGLRAPNGSLDGRRNVRVRRPGQASDPVEFTAQSREADYSDHADQADQADRADAPGGPRN
jgi:hypothetical protein